MSRQASFDVESFEAQIIETILHSPVEISRREIFDKCDFDYGKKTLETAFNRFVNRETTKALVAHIGDRKHRTYIAKNPPIPTEPDQSPPPVPLEAPVHRARPTFTVKEIADASEVTDALKALSEASGDSGLVALSDDKREPSPDHAIRAMTSHYQTPFPVRRIILAAGDVVYDFDIAKILKSVYAIFDNDNIKGFAPFRDFFADHTIISHDALSTCAPLIALDIPPRAMQETRLAVRMLQYQAGIVGDDLGIDRIDGDDSKSVDSFKSSVQVYLKHSLYDHPAAITGAILPLFRELRGRLGDKLPTFDTYCAWLPRLASRQTPFLLSLQHPDLLDCVDLPSCQQVHPTFEILGDGGIQLELFIGPTDDVKASLSFGSPACLSKKKQWWSHFSMIVTVRFGSEAQLCQCLSVLPALADATVVFDYNDAVPERMAITLMRVIKDCVDDGCIRLRLGDGCNDSLSGKVPVGWRDAWWSEWFNLSESDVQSVLNS